MSWECQGRQYHGWFGSGTCADALDMPVLDPATVTDVAYSAFGYLPQNQRRPYESWLRQGGLKQLASALPGWAAGSGLPREAFRERYFGEHGDGVVAAHAQDAGAELAGVGPRDDVRKARAAAGQSRASLVKAARPEAMGRVMAVAARRAAAAAVTSPAAQSGRATTPIAYTDPKGSTPLVLKDGAPVLDAKGNPILVPPGVDIAKNIQVGRSIATMPVWRKNGIMLDKFLPGESMDYQRNNGSDAHPISPFTEVNRSYIQFGNYNFGAIAAAAGYSLEETLKRAGQANIMGGVRTGPFGTNPATYQSIIAGWNAVKQGLLP